MVARLENEPEFRQHFLQNWFEYPDDVQSIIYDRDWEVWTEKEKLIFAELVYDLIHDEPAWEAQETAYREVIGFPVGAISYNPNY